MVKIVISNLCKSFGNKEVLKNISFEVNEGEIFAYIGPNGAGKTTTIRILLNILKPQEGKVEILENYKPLSHKKIGFFLIFTTI